MSFPQQAACKAYWRLDDNSNDATGLSHTGTDTSITYSAGNGKINDGGGWNGSTSKITIADASDIDFGTGAFTVAFWMKTSATSGSIWCDRSGGNSGLQIGFTGSHLYADGVGTAGLTGSVNVATGSFVHCAVVMDRSNSLMRFYVNGSADGTVALGATSATENHTKYIGYDGYAQLFGAFNGAIDEMGLWNVALSSGEITSLYNSGTGVSYPSATVNSGFLSFM